MYYLCCDVGGMAVKSGIVDEAGAIIAKSSFDTRVNRHYSEIIAELAAEFKRLMKDTGIGMEQVGGIGVGVPGLADDKSGNVIFCENLFWRNVPLRAELKKYFDIDARIGNDANIAAVAEQHGGACKGYSNSLLLTLGTGIGGAAVIGGKLYAGTNGGALEAGHIVLVAGGIKCNCGNSGCFERYASAAALADQGVAAARQYGGMMMERCGGDESGITAKLVVDCAKDGDQTAQNVYKQYLDYLAAGIVSLINIFDPEIIAIGGGLSRAGEYLLKPLYELVNEKRIYSMLPPVKIARAEMENDAGLIGAAFLCME